MIVKDYRREFLDQIIGQRIVIIAHHDVDAVCTVKILTNLFKTEAVSYILLSCYGISDLKAKYDEYSGQSRSFILINCGASIDLLHTLSEPPRTHTFFVIDHHRPVHIINYYNSTGQVRVISAQERDEEVPEFNDIFNIEPDINSNSSDNSNNEQRLDKTVRNKERNYTEWLDRRKIILKKYNEHCYYARPSSLFALEIAWVMSRDDMESIWCTIVGLTDSYVMQRVSRAKYTEYASILNDHLLSIAKAEELPRDCLKIRFIRELNLFLYRNWNLYESVLATPLVSTTIKTWSKVGICRFHQLLAQLGLPLVEVKQNYLNMSLDLKQNLVEIFSSDIVTEKFKLPGLIFGSFVADIGYRPRFNALDMQLATLATLEEDADKKPGLVAFLEAMKMLNVRDAETFKRGIEKAKTMLTEIKRHMQIMTDRKEMKEIGPFVFLHISEALHEQNFFRRPCSIPLLVSSLQRAGIRSEKKMAWKSYPWIIMIPNTTNDFIAVGFQPEAYEDASKSVFSEVFRVVKERMNNDVSIDFFDGWLVRVDFSKRQLFIDILLAISDTI